jgi:hypothetical protein
MMAPKMGVTGVGISCGSSNWHKAELTVRPEAEESGKTVGGHTVLTESDLASVGDLFKHDVIGEDTRATVVGETLAKFDDGDQESRLRDLLAHMAESALLVLGRLLAVRSLEALTLLGIAVRDGSLLLVEGVLLLIHVRKRAASDVLVDRGADAGLVVDAARRG